MDFEGVKAGLAGNSITLIDVRNPDEFASGRIPGSKNIPRELTLDKHFLIALTIEKGKITLSR